MSEFMLALGVSVFAIGCLSLATRWDFCLIESRFAFSLRTLMLAITFGCVVAACMRWIYQG